MAHSAATLVHDDARAGGPGAAAGTRCEILPVGCAGGRVAVLVREREPGAVPAETTRIARATGAVPPGWCEELPAHRHPTRVVLDALARELGGVFDPDRTVVHSTSWRYEGGHLVLSYLAVLGSVTEAPPGFALRPVDPRADRSGRTADPAAIAVTDVVVHGIRHLAMLRVSDPAIGAALPGCWHELLAGWPPLPAGLLDHSLPAMHDVGDPGGPGRGAGTASGPVEGVQRGGERLLG